MGFFFFVASIHCLNTKETLTCAFLLMPINMNIKGREALQQEDGRNGHRVVRIHVNHTSFVGVKSGFGTCPSHCDTRLMNSSAFLFALHFIADECVRSLARQRRYDFELVYGTGPTLDKKSRLEYNDSLMTHAMLFTGYDIKEGETSPNKWRVENSWGDGTGPGKPADPHFVYCTTRRISPRLCGVCY